MRERVVHELSFCHLLHPISKREATPYTRGPRGRSRAGAAAEEAAVHMRQQRRQRYSNTPT